MFFCTKPLRVQESPLRIASAIIILLPSTVVLKFNPQYNTRNNFQYQINNLSFICE